MDRRDLIIEKIRKLLDGENFSYTVQHNKGACYDIIAKRGTEMLLLKVFVNIDALKQDTAQELVMLSELLGLKVLIIGERSGSGSLGNAIVYSRHGLPILSYSTFYNYIKHEIKPISFAAPGGFYVKINNLLMRKVRKEKAMSLGDLAHAANVSRRSILMYEEGGSSITVDVVIKLEEYLNTHLVKELDPFEFIEEYLDLERFSRAEDRFKSIISSILKRSGLDIYFTKRSEFDAVTKEPGNVYLTGLVTDKTTIRSKASAISVVSTIMEKDSFLIIDKKEEVSKISIPVLSVEDIEMIKKGVALKSLLEEYK